jgi:hypothetical protein
MHGREGFQTLRRIALLLLALAVLADRATGRGHTVRSRVLFLLRPAQAAARALAEARTQPFNACAVCDDHACDAPLGPDDPVTFLDPDSPTLFDDGPEPGDSPDDAAELAQTFRALALVFFALSRQRPARARIARPKTLDRRTPGQNHAGPRPRAGHRPRAPPACHGLRNAPMPPTAVHPTRMPLPAARIAAPALLPTPYSLLPTPRLPTAKIPSPASLPPLHSPGAGHIKTSSGREPCRNSPPTRSSSRRPST